MDHKSKPDNLIMQEFSECSFIAYEEIVGRYKKKLFNYLLRSFIKDKDNAEDIIQETLIKVYKSKFTYKNSYQFSTWIFTICRNLALNEIRNKRTTDFDSAFRDAEPVNNEKKMYEIVEDNEIASLMKNILQKLDGKYRDVINLRYIEELSYEEISKITGIGENTLKSHCKRGLEKIKKEMEIMKIGRE